MNIFELVRTAPTSGNAPQKGTPSMQPGSGDGTGEPAEEGGAPSEFAILMADETEGTRAPEQVQAEAAADIVLRATPATGTLSQGALDQVAQLSEAPDTASKSGTSAGDTRPVAAAAAKVEAAVAAAPDARVDAQSIGTPSGLPRTDTAPQTASPRLQPLVTPVPVAGPDQEAPVPAETKVPATPVARVAPEAPAQTRAIQATPTGPDDEDGAQLRTERTTIPTPKSVTDPLPVDQRPARQDNASKAEPQSRTGALQTDPKAAPAPDSAPAPAREVGRDPVITAVQPATDRASARDRDRGRQPLASLPERDPAPEPKLPATATGKIAAQPGPALPAPAMTDPAASRRSTTSIANSASAPSEAATATATPTSTVSATPLRPAFEAVLPDPSTQARQIAAQLTAAASVRRDGGTVEVLLDPPDLGRIEIVIELGEQGIRATLSADKQTTADLIRRHIDLLGAQFEEAGFSLGDLSYAAEDGTDRDPGAPAGPGQPTEREHLATPETRPSPGLLAGSGPDGRIDIRL